MPHTALHRAVLAALGTTCLIFLLVTVRVSAQQTWGNSNALEETADNLSTYLYGTARWPVCGAAMLIAFFLFMFSDHHRKKAWAVAGAAGVIALSPWLLALIKTVTGS